jgi:hypothetical protein
MLRNTNESYQNIEGISMKGSVHTGPGGTVPSGSLRY